MLKATQKKGISRVLAVIYVLVFLFTIFCFYLNVSAEQAITSFYVSPDGSDSNPGTLEQPFKTIEKAKEVVRSLTDSMEGDIIVWLRGGTYTLEDTLEFTEEDSGKNGYYVKYVNYPGEVPVISGGKKITGWTEWENGIYRAEVENMEFRQLYVNGTKAVRARTPNVGTYNRLVSWNAANKSIRVNAADLPNVQNLSNGKVEMVVQQYWGCSIMRIASVTESGTYKDLTINTAEGDIVFEREWPRKSPQEAYHFENSLDFIDEGGEWYLDNNVSPHYLYYKPREGEVMDTAEVIAPTVETLVSVVGSGLASKASYIDFQGIIFEHSNWNRPTTNGYIGLQQQQYSIGGNRADRPAAAFYIKNAHNMHITRCVFRNMGSVGLDIYNGTNNIIVEGNVFYEIAGNGVQVGKFSESDTTITVPFNPEDDRELCDSNTIANNYIYRVAQEYYDACGISAGYVSNIKIKHNEITDLPYTGISVGWGWSANDNAMKNNQIEYNHIHNIGNLLCDTGGIYTLGKQPNSTIKYNYIHNIYRSEWATFPLSGTYPMAGIYLDEGSTGFTIDQNCVNDIDEGDRWRINYNQSKDRNIELINPYDDEDIKNNAGLEPAYENIMTTDVPGGIPPYWSQESTLIATDIDDLSITLTWTGAEDEVGVTEYRIFNGPELIKTVDGSVNSIVITGLTPGETYRFIVKAGNALNLWSLDGPVVNVTTIIKYGSFLRQQIEKSRELLLSETEEFWAVGYLESVIDEAQALIDDGNASQEVLDAAMSKLISAQNIFIKYIPKPPKNVALNKPVTSSSGPVGYNPTYGNGGVDNITITPTNARYVRMYGTARGTTWGHNLYEIEVYSPDTTGNLALGKNTKTSSIENSSTPGRNAVDGNMATRWASKWTDTEWISIDLGEEYVINNVKLIWEAAYSSAYELQLSQDGETWTTVFATTGSLNGTEKVVDGNIESFWIADTIYNLNAPEAWIQIDLGSEYIIERVEIEDRKNNNWHGERQNFEILASNDPNFKTYDVLGGVGAEPFADETTWQLNVTEKRAYRYIRYQKTEKIYTYVSEIRVFGVEAPDTYTISGKVTYDSQPIEGAIVNLYAYDDESKILGTAVTGVDGTYTIDTKQSAYRYIAKAVKGDFHYGTKTIYVLDADIDDADIALTVSEENDQFTIGTLVFRNAAGDEIDRLVPSADLKASISITNNFEVPGNACFILALYDSDNRLKNISYIDRPIEANKTFTFNAGFTLPDDVEGYYVKVFVWDSINGMQPLSNVIIFQ
ncbi:MAG TPA: hypothetical protein GXX36_14035 [Clostridiaceae bacterium]|nr:hypothetical protein [Clostridiaceae bacterium]